MEYELAKQLDEAGFPRGTEGIVIHDWVHDPENGEHYYIPTLEELIEACGDDFELLLGNYRDVPMGAPGKWLAEATDRTGICCVGDNPTQAVARLWLALHS